VRRRLFHRRNTLNEAIAAAIEFKGIPGAYAKVNMRTIENFPIFRPLFVRRGNTRTMMQLQKERAVDDTVINLGSVDSRVCQSATRMRAGATSMATPPL
jgi:hypothetical protein